MFQLFNYSNTGQYVHLVTGLYRSCCSDGIPDTKCTYWPVLVEFNNLNIIEFSSKSTSSETFDEIHQVVLDVISDNMAPLVESGKYRAINTTDTSTNGLYVIVFTSGAYTLQENTKIDGKF